MEGAKDQGWLVMMDLNLLINAANLQPVTQSHGNRSANSLERIMKAGASGNS